MFIVCFYILYQSYKTIIGSWVFIRYEYLLQMKPSIILLNKIIVCLERSLYKIAHKQQTLIVIQTPMKLMNLSQCLIGNEQLTNILYKKIRHMYLFQTTQEKVTQILISLQTYEQHIRKIPCLCLKLE